jgi:hypothetical protein
MTRKARLIHQAINRPNIYLCAGPITEGAKSFRNLDCLLAGINESNHRELRIVPQTIIFMDSRKDVSDTTNYLWDMLPTHLCSLCPMAIAELGTALSTGVVLEFSVRCGQEAPDSDCYRTGWYGSRFPFSATRHTVGCVSYSDHRSLMAERSGRGEKVQARKTRGIGVTVEGCNADGFREGADWL